MPLVITDEQLDKGLSILEESLKRELSLPDCTDPYAPCKGVQTVSNRRMSNVQSRMSKEGIAARCRLEIKKTECIPSSFCGPHFYRMFAVIQDRGPSL
jgi:hypothetical protein